MIRLLGYFFGIGIMLALLAAAGVAIYVGNLTKDLPDYEVLAKYEPPVTTRFHAADGSLMAEYAHERRLYLPIQAIPDRVKAAFISADMWSCTALPLPARKSRASATRFW